MKSFAKLTSIALLLCSFVYPPFLAEAKASTNGNSVDQKSVEVEANLINSQTEGILLAQRPYRRRYIRRPYVRRRYIRRPVVRRRYIRRPVVRSRYIRRPYVRRRYIRYY
jgi:hypothetical protein